LGTNDRDLYRGVFALAPSKVAVLGEDDRRKAYLAVNAAIAKDVPKACEAAAKGVGAAHGEYNKAYGNRDTADGVLRDADNAEAKARDEWHTAVRQLKAQLTNLFPRESKKVLRFFPAPAKSKKKALEG